MKVDSFWLLSSLLVTLLSFNAFVSSAPTCVVDPALRVPCGSSGYLKDGKLLNANSSLTVEKIYAADSCLADGCCWMRSFQKDERSARHDCYETIQSGINDELKGYELVDLIETDYGIKGTLNLLGKVNHVYGDDIQTLSFELFYHTADILQFKITDVKKTRWEIPEFTIPRHKPKLIPYQTRNYIVNYVQKPFRLQFIRKENNQVLFTLDPLLVFKDQYIEFSITHDVRHTFNTFGFGESTRLKQALQVNRMYTLHAVDLASLFLSENLYGSLPFYIQQATNPEYPNFGQAHGGLLMNSNSMDVSILKDRINYKITGGMIDFYFFVGPTAKDVVRQSTEIVGKPMMVPFWSLGFHNCRWGYTGLKEIEDIVANYSAAKIPLDTQ